MQNKTFYPLLFVSFLILIISLLILFEVPILPFSTIKFGEMEVEVQGPMEVFFMVLAIIFACLTIVLIVIKIYNEIKKARE